ncbi:long-chain-fatty-acid--CoA ligase [Photobacterium lutimaris]|uniref:Long-chain-fatty-acid--CoA ligase n=1 Tax=Photobacterium lutimaris TaxID=388278 RepID=A0A2T3ILU4_9GAMM|nr:long-chain fatty acid--CoA ligase [Photobacterium lutimaris]PSU29318.1 long-chain-fatty-acid--CoA ligase [Photobacterium lutimaris]TDR70573.1 long-chain acyl-CoA synthetase [Photobacterium lutimaris]
MLNLAVNLERCATLYPSKIAVSCVDKQLTYEQLNRLANQVANGLKGLGLEAGDKVALSCPNLPYFPAIYYGILKAGCTVVPLNVLFKSREVAYHLADSEAKAYFCFDGTPEMPIGEMGRSGFTEVKTCEHFIHIPTPGYTSPAHDGEIHFTSWINQQPSDFITHASTGDDTAVILYTSGTTGRPKGAELTHTNMLTNAMASQYLMRLSKLDTTLITLPLFHSFGQTVLMNASVLSGSSMVLIPRFDPKMVLEALDANQVTVFAGVPTMYIALLAASDHHQSLIERVSINLRIGISGGAAMPVEVLKQFEQQFNIPILEGYGLSETAPVATFNHVDAERIPGSVGQPLCATAVKIIGLKGEQVPAGELGEICINSPSVMKGYYNRPEATEEVLVDGWFHTGDIGRLDSNGYLYIIDRIKEMIVRGGYNVYPREVEEILMEHEAVSMVAVVGLPHAVHGEEIHAFVVLDENHDADEQTLKAWCKAQLADYKYPRHVHFKSELPMSATGKILKRKLTAE